MKDRRVRKGLVIRGGRNIFILRVWEDGRFDDFECRIKGKILRGGAEGGKACYQNPLAPGDWALFEEDPIHPRMGLITAVEDRKTVFTRLNPQGLGSRRAPVPQLMAANADLVLCVTSPASPPFRPRFIDRVLLQAGAAGIEAAVVCNKSDLAGDDPDVAERLEDFSRIGYRVLLVSAKTGAGMDELRSLIRFRSSVLVGQSGVGKSSLANALAPGSDAKVGAMNEKYDRGSHTTAASVMLELPEFPGAGRKRAFLIDTPGVRLFIPEGIPRDEVIFHMREFSPLAGRCSFGLSCTHRTEPGCKILEAVDAGVIHEDRYESFLRIREELAGRLP
jgi:ribosome biogenesis GTPase